jgi:hypothetical protein
VEVNRVVGGRERWMLSRWSYHRGSELTDEDGISPHGGLIRPFCITILYHNLLLFIDIFHI